MLSSLAHALLMLAPTGAQDPVPVQTQPAEAEAWEISGNVFYSDPPGSEDRLTPILYADRGALHFEARYNYEDLETASLWAGWKFDLGDEEAELDFTLTPMLGAVFGETDGVAPGLELDLAWKRFAWYGESEYLIDADDADDNFFYSWSTLTYGVTDWLNAGVVIERSKLVDTDFDVQRGLALEFAFERFGCALYAYNIGSSDDSYAVVSFDIAL
jgi:hypothetical protein